MAVHEFRPGSEQVDAQNRFGDREVGITHPDVPGFIRIRDNGDIELIAGDGLSLIFNKATNSITLVADHINFITKDNGLRWNKKLFNGQATKYNEPTFMVADDLSSRSLYRDVDYFLNDDMPLFSGTTLPEPIFDLEPAEDESMYEYESDSELPYDNQEPEPSASDLETIGVTSVVFISPTGKRFRQTVDDEGNTITEEL